MGLGSRTASNVFSVIGNAYVARIGMTSLGIMLCAGPAFSHCPTGEDRKRGLALTNESPFLSLSYKETSEGLTEQKLWSPAKKREAVNAVYVHPLLVGKRFDKSGTLRLSYSESLADIEKLPQTKTWTSNVVLFSNQRMVNYGKETLTFKGVTQTKVGACSYPVWVIHEQLALYGNKAITFEKYFSPELRLVLRAVNLAPDGGIIVDTTFDKIEAIEGR